MVNQCIVRSFAVFGRIWKELVIDKIIQQCVSDRWCDFFTEVDMVFFDTTSIYFEGEGGDAIGQYGNSKDHRPDRKQIVVGVVLDNEGIPLCCEMWPGNV